MSDLPSAEGGREPSANEAPSRKADEGEKSGVRHDVGGAQDEADEPVPGGGDRSQHIDRGGEAGAPGESGEAGVTHAAGQADDRQEAGDSRGAGAGHDEDIVLTDGKTLSDFLEEEPAPPKPQEKPEYRSVANVKSMIVPPPGGLMRPLQGSDSSAHEGGTQQRDERKGQGRPGPQGKGDGAAPGGMESNRPPAAGAAVTTPHTVRPDPASPQAPAHAPAQAGARRAPIVEEKDEGDFGAMLDSSMKARSFETGESVKGVVVALGPEVAFLDIGGKSEATIDISELKDPEGDIEVEVGETIEALVVATEGGLKLSRRLARGAAAKEQLEEAFRAGLPVDGRVEKAIKGGFEIRIAGQRAFCPISQIDTARTADPSVHIGKVHTFRIIEYKEGGKNLIVSRRALLQEAEKVKAEEARKAIVLDAVMTGRVVSVRDYGAFVDLGGVQGLLHVSEIGWARVSNAADVLKPGDEITVKILKVDEDKGRISLGLKQLQPDPWSRVADSYAPGQVRDGKVVRVQDFGAFVELEPGIEALAHVSTFPPTGTPDGWKKTIPVGTASRFEVLSVDPERKRIGVAMFEEGRSRGSTEPRAEGSAPAPETSGAAPATAGRDAPKAGPPARQTIVSGARLKGKIERHENFGVFVFLAPGRTGLMPLSETATPRGSDLRKVFPVGSEVEVVVLEAEPSGKRIRLSRKALLDSEEKDDAREFAERRNTPESFGSIGDKLRAALASKKT